MKANDPVSPSSQSRTRASVLSQLKLSWVSFNFLSLSLRPSGIEFRQLVCAGSGLMLLCLACSSFFRIFLYIINHFQGSMAERTLARLSGRRWWRFLPALSDLIQSASIPSTDLESKSIYLSLELRFLSSHLFVSDVWGGGDTHTTLSLFRFLFVNFYD